jgi:hypothetical protein
MAPAPGGLAGTEKDIVMATKYTLTRTDGTAIKTYARKDAAIKAGLKAEVDFDVLTDSGNVVFSHEADTVADEGTFTHDAEGNERGNHPTPAEAPAPEDTTPEEDTVADETTETKAEKATPAPKKGTVVVYHQPRKRSKFFFAPMATAGVALAAQQGLTAEIDKEELGVRVIGAGKRALAKFEKDVNLMWDTAYADFKVYKTENKDLRREQMKSRDTLKVMCDAEHVFFTQRLAAYLEEQDVL